MTKGIVIAVVLVQNEKGVSTEDCLKEPRGMEPANEYNKVLSSTCCSLIMIYVYFFFQCRIQGAMGLC